MRKLHFISLLLFGCLGLLGCPYESQVPISHPTIPVDARLLGNWSCKDESYNSYTVTKASSNEYHIVQHNISNTSRYKGHLSEVKGAMFMNLFSDSTKAYYLYKVKMDSAGSRFTLIPISEKLSDHFGSVDGLRNYVEKNMNFQSFYSEQDKLEYEKQEGSKPTALN
ncbi:MAG TPA: hypothetical protein PL009_15300 [Flavipsychrobacter sp.]|nr:hypothetical protein [Flavipsychrobacter sp.]